MIYHPCMLLSMTTKSIDIINTITISCIRSIPWTTLCMIPFRVLRYNTYGRDWSGCGKQGKVHPYRIDTRPSPQMQEQIGVAKDAVCTYVNYNVVYLLSIPLILSCPSYPIPIRNLPGNGNKY